ncbi:urea carboxylase-associated family protein [Streptomyces sp. NPDC051940]|uniref:urea carboxylase-associated family protein n=1 Tax=Streptomyces sp. NPDC051940 TaxID=3155675 RepID=UPI003442C16E
MPRVVLSLTDQQLELVDASVAAGEAPSRAGLVRLALAETAGSVRPRPHPRVTGTPWRWYDDLAYQPGDERAEVGRWELAPGTGKAIEVPAGHVLRVEQVHGNQCVDLNAFNLHDYREPLHVGRTRTMHGLHPCQGDFLWSAPPRERAMMYLLTDTAGLNDTLFPRCSANMYDAAHGFAEHTNCADIQAEAQREYGLTPDDVHDSFNLFMATRVVDGMPEIVRQRTGPGEHVELLALMDVLAVPNICGNDIMSTSNHTLSPVLVVLSTATRAETRGVPEVLSYATQRTPEQFRQPHIRTERGLTRDSGYVPDFARTPVVAREVAVDLTGAELGSLARVRHPEHGEDDPAALRDVLLSWWVASHG